MATSVSLIETESQNKQSITPNISPPSVASSFGIYQWILMSGSDFHYHHHKAGHVLLKYGSVWGLLTFFAMLL